MQVVFQNFLRFQLIPLDCPPQLALKWFLVYIEGFREEKSIDSFEMGGFGGRMLTRILPIFGKCKPFTPVSWLFSYETAEVTF